MRERLRKLLAALCSLDASVDRWLNSLRRFENWLWLALGALLLFISMSEGFLLAGGTEATRLIQDGVFGVALEAPRAALQFWAWIYRQVASPFHAPLSWLALSFIVLLAGRRRGLWTLFVSCVAAGAASFAILLPLFERWGISDRIFREMSSDISWRFFGTDLPGGTGSTGSLGWMWVWAAVAFSLFLISMLLADRSWLSWKRLPGLFGVVAFINVGSILVADGWVKAREFGSLPFLTGRLAFAAHEIIISFSAAFAFALLFLIWAFTIRNPAQEWVARRNRKLAWAVAILAALPYVTILWSPLSAQEKFTAVFRDPSTVTQLRMSNVFTQLFEGPRSPPEHHHYVTIYADDGTHLGRPLLDSWLHGYEDLKSGTIRNPGPFEMRFRYDLLHQSEMHRYMLDRIERARGLSENEDPAVICMALQTLYNSDLRASPDEARQFYERCARRVPGLAWIRRMAETLYRMRLPQFAEAMRADSDQRIAILQSLGIPITTSEKDGERLDFYRNEIKLSRAPVATVMGKILWRATRIPREKGLAGIWVGLTPYQPNFALYQSRLDSAKKLGRSRIEPSEYVRAGSIWVPYHPVEPGGAFQMDGVPEGRYAVALLVAGEAAQNPDSLFIWGVPREVVVSQGAATVTLPPLVISDQGVKILEQVIGEGRATVKWASVPGAARYRVTFFCSGVNFEQVYRTVETNSPSFSGDLIAPDKGEREQCAQRVIVQALNSKERVISSSEPLVWDASAHPELRAANL